MERVKEATEKGDHAPFWQVKGKLKQAKAGPRPLVLAKDEQGEAIVDE